MKQELAQQKKVFIDAYLANNLNLLSKKLKDDFDCVGLISGSEGVGKSALAQQIASYVDPTFTIDRIAFTPEEFQATVLDAPDKSCVIYDEAFGGLNARASMSVTNRTILEMLSQIRQKNLFVLILIPNFFDMDKNVALWRSRFLIHVYVYNDKDTGEIWKRGRFLFFSADQKKKLWIYGKKEYNYNATKANFFGQFMSGYTVDEKEYREKKHESLEAYTRLNKSQIRGARDGMICFLKKEKYTNNEILEALKEYCGTTITSRQVDKIWRGFREGKSPY